MDLKPFTQQEQIWLTEAVDRLSLTFHPVLVLVFGSRARGTATRKSDLDLLVVYQSEKPALERIGDVLQLLSDCPWPLEVVTYTPDELSRIKNRPFIKTILNEGKVVYERRAA